MSCVRRWRECSGRKQFYHYDVDKWLEERGSDPFKATRKAAPRNDHWHHMYNGDVISMPDKWEYPWYAAWDLAFHVLALTLVDPGFRQAATEADAARALHAPQRPDPGLRVELRRRQPAGARLVHHLHLPPGKGTSKARATRTGSRAASRSCFSNFTWWVNRKDRSGRNVFEGGFLGLDNIGVFDRSAPLPTGGYLEQADGTAWMALFCQNMLEIAVELAHDRCRLRGHGPQVLSSISSGSPRRWRTLGGDTGMWDEEDGFFYDVLRLPNGQAQRLKVRSMVGLLPLCAATTFEGEAAREVSRDSRSDSSGSWPARPELYAAIHDPMKPGVAGRRLAAILDETKLRRVLAKMLDENEFLSPYGIRSLSRYHADHPYVIQAGGQEYRVSYLPAESDTGMFGGNSNWRGPIWMPVNVLIIRALLQYYTLLRQRFHRRMSDRLRPAHEPVPGRRGDLAPAREHLPQETRTAGVRSMAGPGSSRRIRTGATACSSTSTSTATTGPASAPTIRPAGRASSPGPCTCLRPSSRADPRRRQEGLFRDASQTGDCRSHGDSLTCVHATQPAVNPNQGEMRHHHGESQEVIQEADTSRDEPIPSIASDTRGTLCDGERPARQVPTPRPRRLASARQSAGSHCLDGGIEQGTHPPARPGSPRPHAAVAVHLLSRGGAQHGRGPGRHARNRDTRAGMRRLSSAEFRGVRDPRTARDLRHQRPGRDPPCALGVGRETPGRQLRAGLPQQRLQRRRRPRCRAELRAVLSRTHGGIQRHAGPGRVVCEHRC